MYQKIFPAPLSLYPIARAYGIFMWLLIAVTVSSIAAIVMIAYESSSSRLGDLPTIAVVALIAAFGAKTCESRAEEHDGLGE